MKTLRLSKKYRAEIIKTLDGTAWFGNIVDSDGRLVSNTGLKDSERDAINECYDWLDNLRRIT